MCQTLLRRLAALDQPGHVTLTYIGRVARLTLHNPDRRNAVSGPMIAQLSEHVDTLSRWDEGAALVLTGAGGHFCAGLDLALARSEFSTPESGRMMNEVMGGLLHRMRQLPLLSVAAIDGYAIGGGAELATATDWRVMATAPGATLRFVHAKMGVSPGWGGGARLVGLVGRAQALRCLAHGKSLDAGAASAIGLCDAVAEAGEPAADAAERLLFAPALAHAASTEALRAIKTAVAAASEVAAEVRKAEAAALVSVWGSGANHRIIERTKV